MPKNIQQISLPCSKAQLPSIEAEPVSISEAVFISCAAEKSREQCLACGKHSITTAGVMQTRYLQGRTNQFVQVLGKCSERRLSTG